MDVDSQAHQSETPVARPRLPFHDALARTGITFAVLGAFEGFAETGQSQTASVSPALGYQATRELEIVGLWWHWGRWDSTCVQFGDRTPVCPDGRE